jgi:predicted amidohydrolase
MDRQPEFTIAAIQAASFHLDREASTEKACRLIEEAAQKGAALAAFGETWLPGYPWWVWEGDSPQIMKARLAYLNSGVEIPSATTDRLCQAAGDAAIDVVIGVAELDSRTHGTVYCTLLFIGREGRILGRHRKLKPTYLERTVWGEGNGSSLRTYERPYGRISGLNCFEHGMMLPGYALVAQGTQIHVAVWPFGGSRLGNVLSAALAVQGSCYVIAVGAAWKKETLPEELSGFDKPWGKDPGPFSHIIEPGGKILVSLDKTDEEAIIIAQGSQDVVMQHKLRFDIAGHYSRPDVLQLHINQRPLANLVDTELPDQSELTSHAAVRDNSADDLL